MSYAGEYGNLSTLDAAIAALIDLGKWVTVDHLKAVDNLSVSTAERYDSMRLLRMIEGLQMVIWRNGGTQPVTGLPMLFDHKKFKSYGGK